MKVKSIYWREYDNLPSSTQHTHTYARTQTHDTHIVYACTNYNTPIQANTANIYTIIFNCVFQFTVNISTNT